jgi:outer membrane receptor for ferrienterochelin and colicin
MRRFLRAVLLVIPVLSASFALAQTTGDIAGRVTDEQGGALPGVTVEARGPALQGVRTAVTDAIGAFRLVLLPPGTYRVTANLQGFARVEQPVVVALGKTSTSEIQLRAAVKEEVVVTGEAPVVDQTSSAVGTNIDDRRIRSLPAGRNYTSIVQISPGVSTQTSNTAAFANSITVYGSTGLENSFVIDGVVTNGVEYGAQGKELNYEFIQEIDVKAGGYQAEFGRSTGGIINVITKSGGNEFHGEAFGYYDNDSLQAKNKHPNETLFGTTAGFTREDFGADLGGYILKDRVWFFGAYDRVDNTTKTSAPALPGETQDRLIETKSTRDLASAKLTWMVTPSQSLVGAFFQDPRVDSGGINDGSHPFNGPDTTFDGLQDLGGQDWSLRYSGLLGPTWVLAAQGALHQERNSVVPSTPEGDTIQVIDRTNNALQSGGFGLIQEKKFKRYFGAASATAYLSKHEVKFGVEYLEDKADVVKRESGGQLVTILPNVDPTMPPVYQHFYWTTPDATIGPPFDAPTSALVTQPFHRTYSVFLQDGWTPLPNLAVNLGVRWDRQQIFDKFGVKQIDLEHSFAPRAGFAWDPTQDHKSKVYGSFGFFYEQIPMDLVIRSYSQERQPTVYNFGDAKSLVPDPAAATGAADSSAAGQGGAKIFGALADATDPHLKAQYLREFLFGVEREVAPNIAVGVRYIYRDLPKVVEDFLLDVNSGVYGVGNPGQGIMSNLLTLDYSGATFRAPKAKRLYRGIQIDATKRFSDNWSLLASYIYSKLEGNYDGLFAPYTQPSGTADPNISALYDYYDFFTQGPVTNGKAFRYTASGPLSNDRRHQVKVSGTYVTPFNLSMGLVAYYRTGTPLSRIGFSSAYSRYEFFLNNRGSEGRVPADYEADLHFGYPIPIGPVNVNVMVDIFNILNLQRAVILDQRYNIAEFSDPNYICGSHSGSDEANCNADYGKPLARTLPREVRFGLRVSF